MAFLPPPLTRRSRIEWHIALRAQRHHLRTSDANGLFDSAIRTIATCRQTIEDMLTYLRRFKCDNALTGEERVAERLIYIRFFDTAAAERSGNLHLQGATPAQLIFLEGEIARFVASGAWDDYGTCSKQWVSKRFLVPKPGVNQWLCIIE
eukprot:jgi/Tetstr1/453413/TSEL_040395.t1